MNINRKIKLYIVFVITSILLLFYFFGNLDYGGKIKYFLEVYIKNRDMYSTIKNQPNVHKINYGPFSLITPKDFYLVAGEGIDMYLGWITNEEDSIYYTYSRYDDQSIPYTREYNLYDIKVDTVTRDKGVFIRELSIRKGSTREVFLSFLIKHKEDPRTFYLTMVASDINKQQEDRVLSILESVEICPCE